MSVRRPLAIALVSSVALAGLLTVSATGASGAPPTNVQPRAAVTNTTTWAAIKTVSLGYDSTPFAATGDIAVNSADDTVYVVVTGGRDRFLVINGRTGTLTDDSYTLAVPISVAVDQNDDTVFIVTRTNVPANASVQSWSASPVARLTDDSVVRAYDLAVDSVDDTVYVTRDAGNDLTYFSGRTPTTRLTQNVGAPSYGIAVDQSDDSIWMTHSFDDSVGVWNGRTDVLGAFIGGVGNQPDAVAVDETDDTVYVADAASPYRIAVINGRTSAVGTTITPGSMLVTSTNGLAVDDSNNRLFAVSPPSFRFGVISELNTDDSVYLIPGLASGAAASYGAVAVDEAGSNHGLVWAAAPGQGRVQALAQVSPTLQAPTTGAAGDTVNISVTSTPTVAFDFDDIAVKAVRFNGATLGTNLTAGAGNTWSVGLPGGLPAGPVSVEVQFNGNQYARTVANYTVLASTPAITSVSPSSGPTSGGTSVTITGANLSGATSVTFGGTAGVITANTATSISVTTPAGAAGAVNVAVTTPGGTATSAGAFTYGSPAPPPPPPLYPPGPPTNVTAVAGDAQATVSWVPPTSVGASPIIEYDVTSAPGYWSCRVNAPATSCTVTGLTNGVSYTFTVEARNGDGWGSDSSPSNAVTPKPPSILITGSRDAADSRFIRVQGTTTDLVGKQVTPYVRFPGQLNYTAGVGVQTVAADGTFAWSRKTGKKISVYFVNANVRSNTVVITAR